MCRFASFSICKPTHRIVELNNLTNNNIMKHVISKDGTKIAFDQTGKGPVIILIAAALSEHSEIKKFAAILSESFTVINYDRRGRGESDDTKPYAVEHEVEDIDALLKEVEGGVYLFGSSSGSALALDAAEKLGKKVKKVAVYEPPFITDDSRSPMPKDLIKQINDLLSQGENNEAVKLFFSKGMGIPSFAVLLMRYLMPGWSKMAKMAATIPYDLMILEGTQDGKPLPVNRWSAVTMPMLVMTGEKSEKFFHTGANALINILPNAKHKILKGQHHGSVVMGSKVIVAELRSFFNA